MTLTLESLPNE
ncbi:unnamed protein product, partial [Adineta ricciae]